MKAAPLRWPVDYARLQYELRSAPSLRLLQKETAPLIVSFLYQQFKRANRIIIPAAELTDQLELLLEELNAGERGLYPRPAHAYLKQWCDEDHRLLRQYYAPGSDDPVFELTPDAEQAISWIEDLQKVEFVGTESRFLRIFELLEEIVGRGSQNAQVRLSQLEAQKAAIEREIASISATGAVEQLSKTQLKERFLEANDTTRRLLADFRAVEQNFRSIAADVQRAQLEQGTQKGAVVGHVLDADAALKESDQGRSFYAFWEFLRSPARQDALRDLLLAVYALPNLGDMRDEYGLLRRLKSNLLDASEKIILSNHRLADQLRRMLDERNLAEGRRVRELIGAIKQAAARVIPAPRADDAFLELEGEPDVSMPMEKPLWEPSAPPSFAGHSVALADDSPDAADLSRLYSQFYIDEERLRQRVAAMLETRNQVTLAEVAAHYPITQGLAEVIGYVQLAAHSAGQIDGERTELLRIWHHGDDERTAELSIPLVTFHAGDR